jgi:hypothetical protein
LPSYTVLVVVATEVPSHFGRAFDLRRIHRDGYSALAIERRLWRVLRSFPRRSLFARYPPICDIPESETMGWGEKLFFGIGAAALMGALAAALIRAT